MTLADLLIKLNCKRVLAEGKGWTGGLLTAGEDQRPGETVTRGLVDAGGVGSMPGRSPAVSRAATCALCDPEYDMEPNLYWPTLRSAIPGVPHDH